MRVGFIGLGNMGEPMAANLLRAGHTLAVHDLDPARIQRFVKQHGGRAAAALADLADSEFVITMLPNGHVVRDVLLGNGGLAASLSAGSIVIDMSSADPAGTRALGADLAPRGISLVDAPVSGGVPRAANSTLAIMIGADDAAVRDRAKGVLSAMGNRLFDTGGLGTGHAMKALNNFVAAAGYSAAVEALLAGKRFGLDPTRMLAILNSSTGRNFNTEVVLQEHVVNQRFATGFSLGLLAKDVGIAADLMKFVGLDAPMAALVEGRYQQALAQLGGQRDNSEAILAWDNNRKEK
ncbi:MAG TPA: NAD(P)-dependent oxidoreductase [Steroidobacteraceae bacterium]|nr:NAD(P)-dependent oxidoreductase [Steroidobacteraceae bacterium]